MSAANFDVKAHPVIDTHCHLDFDDFAPERDQVIERARDAGLVRMVTICTRVRKFDRIKAVAETYDDVFCSVGTHPGNAGEETDVTTAEIIKLAKHPKCVAIGEAGLDFFYPDNAPRDVQLDVFRANIDASRQTGLPLVIHSRAADEDMAATLEEEMGKGAFPFILHCFSAGQELADVGVRLGGYISFSGIVTFGKSDELREIAKTVPHDRLLVETDAPYLAPPPKRGKRNEPSYVINTARILGETIGLSEPEIRDLTTENAYRLFTRMPRAA